MLSRFIADDAGLTRTILSARDRKPGQTVSTKTVTYWLMSLERLWSRLMLPNIFLSWYREKMTICIERVGVILT